MIAYKEEFGDITIVDTLGELVASITNTEEVEIFDWHANNETLYFVDDMDLKFFGPAINVETTNFSFLFPSFGTSFRKVNGICVLPDGTPSNWISIRF